MVINQPVLGVSALIVDGGRVLLVKRGNAPLKGYWSLPGGHVEAGETLADAVAREVREETGIVAGEIRQIDLAELIGREGKSGIAHHVVLVVFAVRRMSGEPVAGDDAAEARWVGVDEMARLKMTEDTKRVIERHASIGQAGNG